MSKALVLAEKPSVGKELARVLNCKQKGNGYFEGGKYIVTWALGHLVTLADPDAYDEKYATWRIEELPMLPPRLKLVVIKQSGKQYQTVKSQMRKNEVDKIIIATDAGREGELVARWIIEKAGVRKPIQRLWISSVTDKAIKEGFAKLKDGREYENLYASAAARAEADWFVGINATRALTCKYNAQLSCGRVQTPTLAIIAQRDGEIQNFRPQRFYGITAKAKGLALTWQDGQNNTRLFDMGKCDQILAELQKETQIEITKVVKTAKKLNPPKLYNLTELQKDAYRIYGYSVAETLAIMQNLYERHKLLTYPRTDSRYLSADMVETLPERVKACGTGPYAPLAAQILRKPLKSNKSFVDDSKVSDHHAIIPTEQRVILATLSEKEQRIYGLVARRFLAVFYPPYEYEQTTVKAKIGKETFTCRGNIILSPGWKAVYGNNFAAEEEQDTDNNADTDLTEQKLPSLNKGDVLKLSSVSQTTGETKPPRPFNEGTLLAAMENPTKYMDVSNKELIKTLDEAGGLGTVATRADIIEKLFKTFLIEEKGKAISLTSKGRQLLRLVPKDLKSPALTGQWEQKLSSIARGSLKKDAFINEMKQYTKVIVEQIKNSTESFQHDNLTGNRCPKCGKYMLKVNGKKGTMLVCQDRECGERIGLAKNTNARCPNCHKKLQLRGQGEGQIFVCPCGHREKLSAFNKRMANVKGSVSKHEVSKFMREQRRAEDRPINTALADALAKLKKK